MRDDLVDLEQQEGVFTEQLAPEVLVFVVVHQMMVVRVADGLKSGRLAGQTELGGCSEDALQEVLIPLLEKDVVHHFMVELTICSPWAADSVSHLILQTHLR